MAPVRIMPPTPMSGRPMGLMSQVAPTPMPGRPASLGGATEQENPIAGLLSNLLAPAGPQNAVSAQLFANAFGSGTDHVNIGTGLPEAFQNRQKGIIIQDEANQAKKDQAKKDAQETKTRQMLSEVPQALQLYDAGDQNGGLSVYARAKGLLPPDPMSVNAGDIVIDKNTGKPIFTAPPKPTSGDGAGPSSVQEYQFYADQTKASGGTPMSFEEWRVGGSKAPRSALGQPVPLKNRKTGEYVPFEPMSDGSMINTLTGEKANAADWMFDPGMVASDKAAGGAYGTAQGTAQFNIDAAKQNVEAELSNIAALKNDPQGIDETFGRLGGVIPQQWTPVIPGTKRADYAARLDQVKGQNFLQAYSTLRGAGAITEAEGAKAQDAMGRLSSAQSKEAYMQALDDLETVLKTGYSRIAQQAGKGPYQSNGFTAAPIGDGATTDDLVTKYLGQ